MSSSSLLSTSFLHLVFISTRLLSSSSSYLSAARRGRCLLNDAGGGRQNCNMAEPMARKTTQHGQHENVLLGLEERSEAGES